MRTALYALIAVVSLLAGAARAQTTGFFQKVTTADSPSFLADPGDGRLFISELGGRIRIFANGALQEPNDAFLTLEDVAFGAAGEGGLHSFAFDPDFATNRRIFVAYTRTGLDPSPLETVIASYTESEMSPNHADLASRVEVLTYQSPQGGQFSNHKGGQLQFGPDGLLYFAFGDGGSGNDPMCLAQTRNVLFGKMLRIDPNGTGGAHGGNYSVPATNPFVGNAAYDPEVWALGLRNPYRFSFDRLIGDLWIGDVGQFTREEVDMSPAVMGKDAGKGLNFGWVVHEGTDCNSENTASCPVYVAACNDPGYTMPVHEYGRGDGSTVIGGYVYRGAVTVWRGRYIFGDHGSGSIWALIKKGSSWERVRLGGRSDPGSFGQDHDGELYVLSLGDGGVYRLHFEALTNSRCVIRLNDDFRKLATSVSTHVRRCVDQGARAKLMSTVDECVAGDPKDRFAKTAAAIQRADDNLCVAAPAVGYAGAATGSEAALAAERNLADDILGADLDAAVARRTADRNMATCQSAVLRSFALCQRVRRFEFMLCKRAAFKNNPVVSSEDLIQCLAEDPKLRVQRACDPTLGRLVNRSIATWCQNPKRLVDLSTAFPGCNTDDPTALAACLDAHGRCRTCELFNAADALETDCSDECAP